MPRRLWRACPDLMDKGRHGGAAMPFGGQDHGQGPFGQGRGAADRDPIRLLQKACHQP